MPLQLLTNVSLNLWFKLNETIQWKKKKKKKELLSLFQIERLSLSYFENFTSNLNRNEIGSPRALYLIWQVF